MRFKMGFLSGLKAQIFVVDILSIIGRQVSSICGDIMKLYAMSVRRRMGVGITERGGRGSAALTSGSFGGDLKPLLGLIVEELDWCRICEKMKFMNCDLGIFRPQIDPTRTKEDGKEGIIWKHHWSSSLVKPAKVTQ
jgi:hypothetical protein